MQPHLFESGNGEYYATLLRQNAPLAFGSDAAMVDMNPLLGIHAAVNAGDESITVYDAVLAYTLGSAFAEFQEKEKGTIELGKLADFVILSDDIFSIEPAKIRSASVVMAVTDGKVAFESK
jgi:predicted amidohydrolase YtcJ